METKGNTDGNEALVPEAKNELIAMKHRIASELSLDDDYWGNVPSKECGRIGGQIGGKMVRDMIRLAEQKLIDSQ